MSFDASLIEYCSPTLASIKAGSLFAVEPEDWQDFFTEAAALRRRLLPKGLQLRIVRCSSRRALCYLYRPAQLSAILHDEKTRRFLAAEGYRGTDEKEILDELCRKLVKGGAFPHEIGVFLGYPLGDVIGFIQNKGQNCLCSGCWKVYSDECAARRTFERYRRCKRLYAQRFREGFPLSRLAVAGA